MLLFIRFLYNDVRRSQCAQKMYINLSNLTLNVFTLLAEPKVGRS